MLNFIHIFFIYDGLLVFMQLIARYTIIIVKPVKKDPVYGEMMPQTKNFHDPKNRTLL